MLRIVESGGLGGYCFPALDSTTYNIKDTYDEAVCLLTHVRNLGIHERQTPRLRERADEAARDLFRHAARHGLITPEAVERWFLYRDNRNDTAHDYGEGFAEATLKLLPGFIADAKTLADMIEETDDD